MAKILRTIIPEDRIKADGPVLFPLPADAEVLSVLPKKDGLAVYFRSAKPDSVETRLARFRLVATGDEIEAHLLHASRARFLSTLDLGYAEMHVFELLS